MLVRTRLVALAWKKSKAEGYLWMSISLLKRGNTGNWRWRGAPGHEGRLDAIYPPMLRALNRHIVCLHVRPLLTHCKGNYILYSPLVRRQMMFPLSIIALACQIVIIKQVNNKFHFWPGYFNGQTVRLLMSYDRWSYFYDIKVRLSTIIDSRLIQKSATKLDNGGSVCSVSLRWNITYWYCGINSWDSPSNLLKLSCGDWGVADGSNCAICAARRRRPRAKYKNMIYGSI